MSKTNHKITPCSVRVVSLFKNGHGALVSLTNVKGTSVENFFSFFDYLGGKKWFLAFVGLTSIKGANVLNKVANKTVRFPSWGSPFGTSLAYAG